MLAEAYGQAGQPEAGLVELDEAVTLAATTEGRWWEAELYRLRGELLLAQAGEGHRAKGTSGVEAEACLRQALAVARGQQAKALELCATTSLSRLWQQQGQHEAACQLLAPIYTWFTEGLATSDRQAARALWQELN